jgi:hypothetical protein
MAYAYTLIASDIEAVSKSNPAILPRTRYVTVFLSDGTPYPRCSANDNLSQYAGPTAPELTWRDSFGVEDFCNAIDPTDPDAITGFTAGTDRNQNYQLFSYVDQLMDLRNQYNVGDIRLHTVLLFNEAAVTACGAICQDVYGQYPGVPAGQMPQAAHTIARWTLQQMAQRGNGVFQEFNNGEIYSMGLGALDYSSLASKSVMKTFLVQGLSAAPGLELRELDSDGEGLVDALDNAFTLKTNKFFPDSDGDCFDDRFEALRSDRGFVPSVKDGRGCDPASPATPNCRCRDTDGDGLSQYAEDFLKTQSGLQDSDGDGVPDGLEVRYGLDPHVPNIGAVDTDGDGLSDLAELKADSNPTARDRAFYEQFGYQYETLARPQLDGSVCYDFTVTNLQLVTPPRQTGPVAGTESISSRQGYNLFKLWFAEAPESGVATDYGFWRTACASAEYDPPSVRDPVGPDIKLISTDFVTPDLLNEPVELKSRCVGVALP